MKKLNALIIFGFATMFFAANANAQSANVIDGSEIIARYNSGPNALTYLTIAVVLALVLVLFFMVDIVKNVRALEAKHEATLPEEERVKHSSWLQLFVLKGSKKDSMENSHEYDGIVEYDNNPPAWFNALFYGTMIFAFGYLMYYHVLKLGDLQIAQYDKQMAAAEVVVAKAQERAIELAEKPPFSDEANLALGKSIYVANCAACHGPQGEGTIGPNLTDDYFLHGGEYQSIFKTIFNGVPEKGMLAWKKSLRPDELRAVASYVNTMKGKNVDGGKAPQGDKFVGDATASK